MNPEYVIATDTPGYVSKTLILLKPCDICGALVVTGPGYSSINMHMEWHRLHVKVVTETEAKRSEFA